MQSNHTPLEDMSAGRGQGGGGPQQNCQKVFIQRDYSEGTMVKFQTRFPQELGDRVSTNRLNNISFYNLYFISIKSQIIIHLL